MNKREIGSRYEQMAAEYMETEGYEIIERNYRCRFGEIDIVARECKDEAVTLVFAEVKYRSSLAFGSPFEAVDMKKQRAINRTANFYMKERQLQADTNIRYDVVGILGRDIKIIKNAFDGIL